MERNDKIVKMYMEEDYTLKEIGEIYDISPQRVKQLIKIYGNKRRMRRNPDYQIICRFVDNSAMQTRVYNILKKLKAFPLAEKKLQNVNITDIKKLMPQSKVVADYIMTIKKEINK